MQIVTYCETHFVMRMLIYANCDIFWCARLWYCAKHIFWSKIWCTILWNSLCDAQYHNVMHVVIQTISILIQTKTILRYVHHCKLQLGLIYDLSKSWKVKYLLISSFATESCGKEPIMGGMEEGGWLNITRTGLLTKVWKQGNTSFQKSIFQYCELEVLEAVGPQILALLRP